MSTELKDNARLEKVCRLNLLETIVNTFVIWKQNLCMKKFSREKNDLTLLLKRFNIHFFNKQLRKLPEIK